MIQQETLEYQRDTVKLVVENIEDNLVMSYADLDMEDMFYLTQYFIDKLSSMTGQEYNQVLEDLKEIEDQIIAPDFESLEDSKGGNKCLSEDLKKLA